MFPKAKSVHIKRLHHIADGMDVFTQNNYISPPKRVHKTEFYVWQTQQTSNYFAHSCHRCFKHSNEAWLQMELLYQLKHMTEKDVVDFS